MLLKNVIVRPVLKTEELRFKKLMQEHHYLGFVPKISQTIWYVGVLNDQWVSLISFSVSALKCRPRDEWIGWNCRYQYGRLKLIVNNNRFLILPGWNIPNLASKILSLCLKRLNEDWIKRFGHRVLLVETFVDPKKFRGTIYKASNWICVGKTRGFRKKGMTYIEENNHGKLMFVRELNRKARRILSQSVLDSPYQTGEVNMSLKADQMRSLPEFFKKVTDPRRTAGKRHQLSNILSLAAAAVLCGMEGYKAISTWVNNLSQTARERFNCRYENGKYMVPSESTIRNVLIRVNPDELNKAIQDWNSQMIPVDATLAIDGKTMCNALDEEGRRTQIVSIVGQQSKCCYTQKK